LIYLPRI